MPLSPDRVIELLGLEPLPEEGGWFRETYRSTSIIPGGSLTTHAADRCVSTQIYYLLRSGSLSAMHRVRSDEVFHHYLGAPVTQIQVDPEGNAQVVTIGSNLEHDERPQVVVPAHWWQGACLSCDLTGSPDSNAWALLGCTVSPGFEWDDFELSSQAPLPTLTSNEHQSLLDHLSP